MVFKKALLSRCHLEDIIGVTRSRGQKLIDSVDSCYSSFDRCVERNGKEKWRHIDNPHDELKIAQRRLNSFILNEAVFPDDIIGGVRHRSVKDHAARHVGQPLVVALDLADYFPHITNRRVFHELRQHLGCGADTAKFITRLTTLRGHIPQGAPTSTTIANIASLTMFREISSFCKTRGLMCSFYIDDIAISGHGARLAIGPIKAIVGRFGQFIRKTKTDIMPQSTDQSIGNILVNHGLSNKLDRLKAIVSDMSLQAAASVRSMRLMRKIKGQIAYARWINEAEGESLTQLMEFFLPDGDMYSEESDVPFLVTTVTSPCRSMQTCKASPLAVLIPKLERSVSPTRRSLPQRVRA